MSKRYFLFVLLALLSIGTIPATAQVSNTGPAGLARQMPRIYGPYMANASRIKNQQRAKHKHKQKSRKKKSKMKSTHH